MCNIFILIKDHVVLEIVRCENDAIDVAVDRDELYVD